VLHHGVVLCDPGLACVPALLDDPSLAFYFCALLDQALAGDQARGRQLDLEGHLRRCALAVAPALRMATVRGPHMANHQRWSKSRAKELAALFVERDAATGMANPEFRGLAAPLRDVSWQHEPLLIEEMALDLCASAVPYSVHAH